MFLWVVCPVVCSEISAKADQVSTIPTTMSAYRTFVRNSNFARVYGVSCGRERITGKRTRIRDGARKRAVHHRSIRYEKRAVDRDTGGRDNRPYKGFGTSQFADAVQAGLCRAEWSQFCPGTARSEAGLCICSLRSVDQGCATYPGDHQRTHARICLDRCAGFAGCSLRRALNASEQPVQRVGCWLALACLL